MARKPVDGHNPETDQSVLLRMVAEHEGRISAFGDWLVRQPQGASFRDSQQQPTGFV